MDVKAFENHTENSNQQQELKDKLLVFVFEHAVEDKLWNPTFITDFPLSLCPLTKKHRLATRSRIAERFEPYIAGMEIGNAYTELNDPIEQAGRLKTQARWSDVRGADNRSGVCNPIPELQRNQAMPVDENFIHALEVGMPPTGGVGLGIERLVMILTDQGNIKDSMLFPMLKEKS